MHQPNSDPDVGKAAPTTKSNATSHKQQNDCRAPSGATQSKSKFSLIWAAPITPPATKLVLLALTNYSDANGYNMRPSVPTIAAHCGLSVKHTRRHIHELLALGAICITNESVGRATTYRLGLDYLHECGQTPPAGGSPLDGRGQPLTPPAGGSDPSRPRTKPLPPAGVNPNDPDVSQEREGSVPPGSAAAPAPRGPAPQVANCPEWVDKAALQRVGETGLPGRARNVDALVQSAIALHAAGATPTAINAELVAMGTTAIYKTQLLVTVAKAPTKPYGRTTGRKTASSSASREARTLRARHLGGERGAA